MWGRPPEVDIVAQSQGQAVIAQPNRILFWVMGLLRPPEAVG